MNGNGRAIPALILAVWSGLALCPDARADQVQDATITARIETAYVFNEHLNPFDIRTSTRNGTVTLEGTVESPIQRDLAEQVAKSVVGVKQVVNNIRVASQPMQTQRPDQWSASVNDASVTASVRTRLQGLKDLDASRIEVDTRDGTVVLSGTVPSQDERRRAESIARSTRGVRQVENNIRVSSQGSEQAQQTQARESRPRQGVRVGGRSRDDAGAAREGEAAPRVAPQSRPEQDTETPPRTEARTESREAEGREEAMRLRREANEKRNQMREQIRERQREFDEEHRDTTDRETLRQARAELHQEIVRMRHEAEREAAELERRADLAESGATREADEARREASERTGEAGAEVRKTFQGARARVADVAGEARERAEAFGETVGDEWIEKRIEIDLALNKNLDMGDLDVEVDDGVAVLTGSVASLSQKQLAERVAQGVNGVRTVRNRIRVVDGQG